MRRCSSETSSSIPSAIPFRPRAAVGGATLVEGHAGTGKSRLLREAAAAAAAAGMRVLQARGDELEREFAFGVALGLLEDAVRSAAPEERARILAGAAQLAEPLFAGGYSTTAPRDPQGLYSLVHGLYWVTQNLADGGPLLLLVDDAQWGDEPSLRLLAYLAQRIADMPVALMAARRIGEEPGEPPLLRELAGRPLARRLGLSPLSPQAVARLVRAQLAAASDGFCAACGEATAGNPFFLEELLRTVTTEEVEPSDEGAAQIRALAPDAVSRSILLRLSRLPPEATALARAVAVLGEAPLVDAIALVQLKPDAARAAARMLVATGVLTNHDPVSFSHPIVRAAVSADMTYAERGRLALRAAEQLDAGGAPPERVSAHLLAAPAAREAWVTQPLRLAAANALASGAPVSAARYLRRALAEPPSADAEAEILVELGEAEAAAAEPEAAAHLRAALTQLSDPLARARVRLTLGRALSGQGDFAASALAFQRGEADARGRDPDLLVELEAGFLGVARFEPALQPEARERMERLVRQPPQQDSAGLRPVLADIALARAWSGAPVSEVLPLATRAWANGALLAEQGPDSHSIYVLAGAILAVDELQLELQVLDAALREAQRNGSVMAVATASYCRSIPLYLQARIPEALADAEQAVGAESDGWEMFLPCARAFLALSLLERGEVDAADRALELRDPERWRDSLPYVPFLDARARVRLAQRRPEEALADALENGRLIEESFGGTGRGYVQGAARRHSLSPRPVIANARRRCAGRSWSRARGRPGPRDRRDPPYGRRSRER